MDLNYNIERIEELLDYLFRDTLSKKGVKGLRNLLDDIMYERTLDVDASVREELGNYTSDTIRLAVEKQILLSLENSSLANRKSYWDVLKTRAPRIKAGIISHYYDNYINFLKAENPDTYQARTITELKETYDKAIGESINVINEMGSALVQSVPTFEVQNAKELVVKGEKKGSLKLFRTNAKFVNKDEFVSLLDMLSTLPNGESLITNKENLSIKDLKMVTDNITDCLHITTREDKTKEVTVGQAGVLYGGELDETATLPDGTYVSMDELNLAVNKYLEKPKEQEQPLKVSKIKQKIKKKVALLTMSITLLTAALPAIKKNVETNAQTIVNEIDNTMSESNMTMVTEQIDNALNGMSNAIELTTEKATELGNAAMEAISTVPETIQGIVDTPMEESTQEVIEEQPVIEVATDDSIPSGEGGQVVEPIEETVEVSEPTEEVQEVIEPVTEEQPVEETVVEENNEETNLEEQEDRLATSSDFSFKFDESNEIAAAARNKGFTDEQIKMAVAISRQETGNYTSPAFLNKHNYGGMMTKDYVPITFSSEEEGLDRYLTMLQDKYFGKGLDTLEKIGRVYDPKNPAWPGKVKATLESGGLQPQQVEETEEVNNVVPTEEVTPEVNEPVEEKTEEVVEETAPVEEKEVIEEKVEEQPKVEEVVEPITEEERLDKIPTSEKEKIAEQEQAPEVEEVVEPIKEEVKEEPKKEEKEVVTQEPVQAPVVEQPIVETPVVPVQEVQPVVETPVVETPVVETPVVQAAPTGDAASMLGLTPQQLDVVKATIRHEAGNNPAEMANVASCVKNRMNNSGANAYAVITAPKQFESYGEGYYKQYTGGNYYQGDAATAAQVDAMLDAILTGQMAPTHSYSSFRGKSSPKGVQLVEGGNKYR